jgi:multisubunit Na+/H+ antiporter MnhB subunit
MKKIVVRNGLIAGSILIIMMVFSLLSMRKESIDFGVAEVVGYLTMLLALSMVFFGIRSWKKQQAAPLTFKQGFISPWLPRLYTLLVG